MRSDASALRPWLRRAGRLAFGDRVGLALWLGVLLTLAITWRVGFFITDTYAIANTLVSVARGHLAVTEVRYSLSILSQPGLFQAGGQLYGRNYGQVFFAVPFAYGLQVATALAPLHLVLAAGWSLGVVAFARQLGTHLDRRDVRVAGSLLALVAFAANAVDATVLDPTSLHLVALQLSTLVAAAFAAVFAYRLAGVFHDQRVALAAGVATVVAFPLGAWAAVPKRHVLVTALVLGSVYGFARSRRDSGRRADAAIGVAYVFAGLVAWIHAFEGFFVLATLATVDVVTGGIRDRRRFAVVAGSVLVGLAPMFLTNVAIGGNPLEPPRVLARTGDIDLELAPTGDVQSPSGGGETSGGGGGTTEGGSSGGESSGPDASGSGSTSDVGGGSESDGTPTDGESRGDTTNDGASSTGGWPDLSLASRLSGLTAWVQGILDRVAFALGFVGRTVVSGVESLDDPGRLYHVFVRSGRIPSVDYAVNQYEAIELTVLESAPVLGALLALPAVAAARIRAAGPRIGVPTRPSRLPPVRQTDLLVCSLVCVLTVVYLHRLPTLSQITVRYLLPATTLGVYGLVRLRPVREGVSLRPQRLWQTYASATLLTVALVSAALSSLDVAVGEAMQFHALVNLGVAATLAALVAGRTWFPERVPVGWLTDGLAVAGGVTTALVLLIGVEYFQYGPFSLAVARHLSTLLPIL